MDNSEKIVKVITGERNLHPADISEALVRWDDGENLFSVEMGGLGPGYEQAIQVTFIELLRACNKNINADSDIKIVNETLEKESLRINKEMDLRLSGAQAGAAKNLAWNFLQCDSWLKTLETVPRERHIQICKNF